MIGPVQYVHQALAPTRAMPLAASAPAAGRVTAAEAEREIARLTWAVLDGSASLADRQQLGELVRVQHASRRRSL